MILPSGNTNWHRHVLQFQLEKWPQGWEVQVSTLTCVFQKQMQRWEKCSFTCIIQFLSLDRFWLTFKTPQHPPQSIRWITSLIFALRNLYRSHFWWPPGLALTRWFYKVWQNQSEKQAQQNCWQNWSAHQGLTLVLDRHSHKVSAATVAEDFKGKVSKILPNQDCKWENWKK